MFEYHEIIGKLHNWEVAQYSFICRGNIIWLLSTLCDENTSEYHKSACDNIEYSGRWFDNPSWLLHVTAAVLGVSCAKDSQAIVCKHMTLQTIHVNKIGHKRMYCSAHYTLPMYINMLRQIDIPAPIHIDIHIHYTVLHKFCTVYWSRVYAVHCAHVPAAATAAILLQRLPSTDRLSDAAAAPSQLFKPHDARHRLTGRSFKQQMHHGL